MAELARLESGHTPSRKHPEYWGGDVPWISIPDAKRCHGGVIDETEESTNALGLANSSARLIPASAVCLSRTASVGYVTITGRPMATSQDFVNWICGDQLLPKFLQYLFIAEGESLLRFASGAVHKTIYFPEVKAFHVCVPDVAMQRRIVAILDEAFEGIATAKANAEKNLQNARELFQGALRAAFQATHGSWERRALVELCLVDWGNTDLTKASYVESGEFLAVSAAGCDGRISHAEHRAFTPVMSAIGAQCGRMFLPTEDFTAIKNTITLTPRAGVCSGPFLFRLLTAIELPKRGAAQPFIAKGDIQSFTVLVPKSLPEQESVVDHLDQLQAKIDDLSSIYQRRVRALDELKKSLLHQAFTGQL